MKAVILAGGFGTRISEETGVKPKPMVEIGGKPILWHIMKYYSEFGINEFIICLGYKGDYIKQFFANYYLSKSDVTFDLASGKSEFHGNVSEKWKVTLVDTGEKTMTGGRLKRVKKYIGKDTFCMTYGDGLTNMNLREAIKFHKSNKSLVTLTAVQPPGRFGAFTLDSDKINSFSEKPKGDGAWVNGGYFILEPKAIDYVAGDATVWEQDPLKKLAKKGHLCAYRHAGFWQPMDTLRDKMVLEEQWASGKAPWKIWK